MSEENTITEGMPTENTESVEQNIVENTVSADESSSVETPTAVETAPVAETVAEEPATVAETVAEEAVTAMEPVEPIIAGTVESPVESTPETVTTEAAAPTPTPEEAAAAEEARLAAKRERERKRAEENARRQKEQEERDATFAELEQIKANDGTIVVNVGEKVKGGYRVTYKNVKLFLPSSHYSLKRVMENAEADEAIGKDFTVHLIEAKKDEQNRTTLVVSRKRLLEEEFYAIIKAGDTVTGTVSSISTFGVFVDLNGGVEGLIHISRLSQQRVEDANGLYKRGDKIEAKVISIDREKHRISLSRREFEPSPWEGLSEKFPVGLRAMGKVKRLAEFGAYVALAPGIEGLLRNSELSWGRRIGHPSEILKVGQDIMVQVLSTDEAKKRLALGYKQTQPNPWESVAEKYPIGMEVTVTLSQSTPRGLVVRVSDDLEGFMPRGRMGGFANKTTSLVPGDSIESVVIDINGESETFILAPKDTSYADGEAPAERNNDRGGNRDRNNDRGNRGGRSDMRDREDVKIAPELQGKQTINLMDLLSEEERERLRG